VPLHADARLDDLGVGDFEGKHAEAHRDWRQSHARSEAPSGGESLEAARLRYVQVFDELLARTETVALVIGHELSLRYLLNAATGSDHMDRPIHQIANATPYVFDEVALGQALTRLRQLPG
jgi:broad specificity phosphatase PhoE